MTERLPKTHCSKDKQRCNVFRLESVANDEEGAQCNEDHCDTLAPAKRAGRVSEHVAEDHVCNTDRNQEDDNRRSAKQKVKQVAARVIQRRISIICHGVPPKGSCCLAKRQKYDQCTGRS